MGVSSHIPFIAAWRVLLIGMVLAVLILVSIQATALAPAALLTICEIQGDGFISTYAGQSVRTQGVVYADLDTTGLRGFFLQAENCDADSTTSDGLFVYLGQRIDIVQSGSRVEVAGLVEEYYGRTELIAQPDQVTVLARQQTLPSPASLELPFDPEQAYRYAEAHEGMYLSLENALAAGPTDADGRAWLVSSSLGLKRVFWDDLHNRSRIFCVDDRSGFAIQPPIKTGDRVARLEGALDFAMGVYCLQLTAAPQVYPVTAGELPTVPLPPEETFYFRAATFNLAGLFDPDDDPLKDDRVLSTAEYQRRLQKRALAIYQSLRDPDILAVQEVENERVLQDLIARPELDGRYQFVWDESSDRQGMDVALLYRSDRAALAGSSQSFQGCTPLVDGLGPDGNGDVANPANDLTCDTDGDGRLDGNRLFSRLPLLVPMRIRSPDGLETSESVEVWFLVNHWKSKVQDTSAHAYTAGRRLEQARFVASLARQILAQRPETNLVVLGDFNDSPDSAPLQELAGAGLTDFTARIFPAEKYTYIYQGVSQVLDSVWTYTGRDLGATSGEAVHINSDYPPTFAGVSSSVIRSSDHDPVWVEFRTFEAYLYLPTLPQ